MKGHSDCAHDGLTSISCSKAAICGAESREITILHDIHGAFHGSTLFIHVGLDLLVSDVHWPTAFFFLGDLISPSLKIAQQRTNDLLRVVDYSLDDAGVLWFLRLLGSMTVRVGVS